MTMQQHIPGGPGARQTPSGGPSYPPQGHNQQPMVNNNWAAGFGRPITSQGSIGASGDFDTWAAVDKALRQGKPSVVGFCNSWTGPGKIMQSLLMEQKRNRDLGVDIYILNHDFETDKAIEYQIDTAPAVLFFSGNDLQRPLDISSTS